MGYTDLRTDFLIGLGASSISDIGSAFAQNAKSVEGYIEQVRDGRIPVVKGHLLDKDELMIRHHILNLTCKHATSWNNASQSEQVYMRNCLRKLDEADGDGLIERSFDEIRLTEKGKFFVRNVCAAFDKDYLGKTVTQKYSMGV
jgi:oxygen-independent coproporphyrinogen-3 oxidase